MRIVSSRAQALRQSSVKEIALRLIDGRQQKTDDAGGLQSAQSRIPGRFGLVGWKLGLINSISVRSPRTRLGWAILCGTDAVDHEEIAIALTTTIEANLKCSEGVVSRSPEKSERSEEDYLPRQDRHEHSARKTSCGVRDCYKSKERAEDQGRF